MENKTTVKTIEVFGSSNEIHFFKFDNGNKGRIIRGTASVIEWLKDRSFNELAQILNFNTAELEEWLKKKRKSARETVIDILSAKWFCRETDIPLILSKTEWEEFDFMTFQQIKNLAKKDKLTNQQLSRIIEYFTNENSEWYCPKGFYKY